jgi:DNA-binding response OmpR family regulator
MSDEQGADATVLIVEDEERAADAYARALQSRCDVDVAHGGEEALQKIDEDIDVVLLDRRMPEMSGDEVLREIQTEKHDCRVAMVTAVNPDFDIVDMFIDDYVVKPVGKDELVETVQHLLALDEYDETAQELSSLKVRLNVLEVEKHEAELAESEEFTRLKQRIENLESELKDMEEELEIPDKRSR